MVVAAASQRSNSRQLPPLNTASILKANSLLDLAPGKSSNLLSALNNSMTCPCARDSTRLYVNAKSTTAFRSLKLDDSATMIYFPKTLFELYKICAQKILSLKGYLNIKTFSFDLQSRRLPSSYYF